MSSTRTRILLLAVLVAALLVAGLAAPAHASATTATVSFDLSPA